MNDSLRSDSFGALNSPRRWLFVAAVCLTLGLALGVECHALGLNGPQYWQWPWRKLDGVRLIAGFAVALVPFIASQWLFAAGKISLWRALALLMLTTFLLQLVALAAQTADLSLARLAQLVESPSATSYFTEATRLHAQNISLRDWLDKFPSFSGRLALHAQTKPPGPILFYLLFVHLFGPGDAAAAVGGLSIAILATCSVPATAFFIRALTGDVTRGFWGASFLALCPGLVLFLPELDQLYPILTCGLLGCWALALRTEKMPWACACGVVLGLTCFATYSLLTLGSWMLGLAMLAITGPEHLGFSRLAKMAAATLASFAAVQLSLAWSLHFDPLATFFAALRNQAILLQHVARPYPATVLFDLTDFAMGAGWLGGALALLGAWRGSPNVRRVSFLCLAQLLLVAVLALLPGETARVWLFMLPLLMVPLDAEMTRLSARQRVLAFGIVTVAMTAICRNMVFIA